MDAQQAPGQGDAMEVSVHGHPNADTLLLWHPAVSSDPEGVARLASRIAGRSSVRVVLPRWSDGRDLLRSIRYARESSVHPPDGLSVVGYGAAGIAALSVALHQSRLGIGLVRATCVDGSAELSDPISGQPLEVGPSPAETAVDIVETDDGWAAATTEQWRAQGWSATLVPADQFTWRV